MKMSEEGNAIPHEIRDAISGKTQELLAAHREARNEYRNMAEAEYSKGLTAIVAKLPTPVLVQAIVAASTGGGHVLPPSFHKAREKLQLKIHKARGKGANKYQKKKDELRKLERNLLARMAANADDPRVVETMLNDYLK